MSGKTTNHFWRFGDAAALQKLISLITLYQKELTFRGPQQSVTRPRDETRTASEGNFLLDVFPEQGRSESEIVNELLSGCDLMDWASATNGIGPCSPPTVLSIFGSLLCAHLGPNLGWRSFSGTFGEIEERLTRLLCDLIGFTGRQSVGVSTYGGAGAILYGIKAGSARITRHINGRRNSIKVLRTAGGHFSVDKAANWLGLENDAVIDVRAKNGRMDLIDLQICIDRVLSTGEHVGCVVAEIGTTYDFAFDSIARIREICDHARSTYSLPYNPFIHADGAVGGLYLVFRDYDTSTNVLHLHDLALKAIDSMRVDLQSVQLADSVGIDFHKLGFAPLISTMFVLRDAADAEVLIGKSREGPEEVPVRTGIRKDVDPSQWTLEASRSAAGALNAYMNCLLLGKHGYRESLGRMLWLASELRNALARDELCRILNRAQSGPSIVMRWYPNTESWQAEATAPDLRTRLHVDQFNHELFHCYERLRENETGLELGLITRYEVREEGNSWIATCLKACLASPNIGPEQIAATLKTLRNCYTACATRLKEERA
jgi:L-2,4-diaminobutyrate decarboxylase